MFELVSPSVATATVSRLWLLTPLIRESSDQSSASKSTLEHQGLACQDSEGGDGGDGSSCCGEGDCTSGDAHCGDGVNREEEGGGGSHDIRGEEADCQGEVKAHNLQIKLL